MDSVIVKICMPSGKGRHDSDEPERTLEDLVADWMAHVESGLPSEDSWRKLRTLFNRLANRKSLSDRQVTLLRLMEPIMAKYGRDSGELVDVKGSYPYQQKGK